MGANYCKAASQYLVIVDKAKKKPCILTRKEAINQSQIACKILTN